jgi:hypothetical protein
MSGCATAISYRLPASAAMRRTPLPYRVIVGVFPDERPERERISPVGTRGFRAIRADRSTSDKQFKPDVPRQIAMALAVHLQQSKLVGTAIVQDVEDGLEQQPDRLHALAQERVDLVITGRLAHFAGYRDRGRVEYRDVKLIDVADHGVLWQGTISHAVERTGWFSGGSVAHVLEALREANQQLAETVRQVLEQDKVRVASEQGI